MTQQKHLTNSVIMVRPIDFGFNEQTGQDNEFQSRPHASEVRNINSQVNAEFDAAVTVLQNLSIETLILGKEHTNADLPDAIFPNNWFCTRSAGDLHIFPMKTKNRQDEVQIDGLTYLLNQAEYDVRDVVDLRKELEPNSVLEGTGSIIFHHPSKIIFAALSERCQRAAIESYAERFGYQLVAFDTKSSNGAPIYHTNVLMSCGEDFVVFTDSIVTQPYKKTLLDSLANNFNEIVTISEEQMTNSFCGNILQLEDNNQQPVIALSYAAYSGFTSAQKKTLESKGSLAVCKIPTIERIGGGSVRCMLAENFLPLNDSL